jgi:hypothetical protein
MQRFIPILLAALLAAVAVPVAASGSDRSSSRDDRSGDAATVKSFSNGVLTLAVADGDELSGRVTRRTDVECDDGRRGRASRSGDDSSGSGKDKSGRGETEAGDDKGGRGEKESGDDKGGDRNRSADDKGDRGDERSRGRRRGRDDDCGTEALKAGAKVHKAELRVSAKGLIWDEVELAG